MPGMPFLASVSPKKTEDVQPLLVAPLHCSSHGHHAVAASQVFALDALQILLGSVKDAVAVVIDVIRSREVADRPVVLVGRTPDADPWRVRCTAYKSPSPARWLEMPRRALLLLPRSDRS